MYDGQRVTLLHPSPYLCDSEQVKTTIDNKFVYQRSLIHHKPGIQHADLECRAGPGLIAMSTSKSESMSRAKKLHRYF